VVVIAGFLYMGYSERSGRKSTTSLHQVETENSSNHAQPVGKKEEGVIVSSAVRKVSE
jgi:hypothetical protein